MCKKFSEMSVLIWSQTFEVSIVADKFVDPDLVAADLIAQAEHDVNAQSILITNNNNLTFGNLSTKKQLTKLPRKILPFKA